MQILFEDSVAYGQAELKKQIKRIRQLGGSTMTGAALEDVKAILEGSSRKSSDDVAKYVVILTDGATRDVDKVRAVVPQILKMDVTILAVGVGSGIKEDQLLLEMW